MKVGVIGLGAMGGAIAGNLLKKGFSVVVHDVRDEVVEKFVLQGAEKAESARQLGEMSQVVLTLLPMSPFDPTLEAEILDGILPGMKSGGTIIDCGNTSPVTAKELYDECRKKGVSFLDAPVSGGPEGASNGALSVMLGGDEETVEKVRPVLEAISKKITYLGKTGSGMMMKLVNNIIVAVNLATISESLVLAIKVGLDPEAVYECLSSGAAQSWVMDNYGKGLLERTSLGERAAGGGFSGKKEGGRDKQLTWAIDIASDLDVPVPVTVCTHELYKLARIAGKSGYYEPIIEMYEEFTDVFFSRHRRKTEE